VSGTGSLSPLGWLAALADAGHAAAIGGRAATIGVPVKAIEGWSRTGAGEGG
jgi:hypothetical protein